MSTATLNLDAKLRDYLLGVTLRELPVLRDLREETSTMPRSSMQISPEQGQFMTLLTRLIGARRTIEVGTFTGYSAICVALALPDGGKLLALDIDAGYGAIARRYFERAGVTDRVDQRFGPGLISLDALLAEGQAGTFDLAFIDADKENYLGYYERCLALVRPNGCILVDNVLWQGSVIDPNDHSSSTEAIRRFNQFLHGDDSIDLAMLPIGDGLTVARKR